MGGLPGRLAARPSGLPRLPATALAWLALVLDLRDLGCDVGQGFYLERPQPSEAIGELLTEGTSWRPERVLAAPGSPARCSVPADPERARG